MTHLPENWTIEHAIAGIHTVVKDSRGRWVLVIEKMEPPVFGYPYRARWSLNYIKHKHTTAGRKKWEPYTSIDEAIAVMMTKLRLGLDDDLVTFKE